MTVRAVMLLALSFDSTEVFSTPAIYKHLPSVLLTTYLSSNRPTMPLSLATLLTASREALTKCILRIKELVVSTNKTDVLSQLDSAQEEIHVQQRIKLASSAFGCLSHRVFLNHNLTIPTKVAVYNAVCNLNSTIWERKLDTILSSSKTWSLSTSQVCNAFLNFPGVTESLTPKFGTERAVNLWNWSLYNDNYVGLNTMVTLMRGVSTSCLRVSTWHSTSTRRLTAVAIHLTLSWRSLTISWMMSAVTLPVCSLTIHSSFAIYR